MWIACVDKTMAGVQVKQCTAEATAQSRGHSSRMHYAECTMQNAAESLAPLRLQNLLSIATTGTVGTATRRVDDDGDVKVVCPDFSANVMGEAGAVRGGGGFVRLAPLHRCV